MNPHEITRILLEYLIAARPKLAEVKNLEDVSLNDVLDSLDMLGFVGFVEERFDLKIESGDFTPEQFSTVILASQFISHNLAIRASS
jgi:acyl carrier protein